MGLGESMERPASEHSDESEASEDRDSRESETSLLRKARFCFFLLGVSLPSPVRSFIVRVSVVTGEEEATGSGEAKSPRTVGCSSPGTSRVGLGAPSRSRRPGLRSDSEGASQRGGCCSIIVAGGGVRKKGEKGEEKRERQEAGPGKFCAAQSGTEGESRCARGWNRRGASSPPEKGG